ncbi:imidazole glycerol phosphate synthase subunit HisH [Sneathiella chinensis]|uniref:Imidazole glycerol phosphate synthase subunit HisH n=1 Tax=Sneathiella chinensis TaxID=349750 RepID=A0ABQ5TZF3_9PROT|nr:imidazole glycerol phosphate synthase subunit HisH [Sneathiella chinensis]GLQ05250.1 imidazole glycerol phosphate synthase subunit HisH [Sneathiella chinensis]
MIAIIDYGSGNLRSAAKAFERAARESGVGAEVVVTSDPDVAAKADRIVLPGVGAFRDCRENLFSLSGMAEALEEAVIRRAVPFFGICVGMQLMASRSLEYGETEGFGWIKGQVEKLVPNDPTLKIPHMGWNDLTLTGDHVLLDGLSTGDHMYFVHSYHMIPDVSGQVLATVDYGGAVTAMVGRDNMIGTQFHPEKSQAAGLRLIANFLNWKP